MSEDRERNTIQDVDGMFATIQKIADPFLEKLGLSKELIEQKSLPELELSLKTIRSAIQRPEAFGTVNLTVSAAAGFMIAKADTSSHIQVTILPVLLEREQLIVERMRALDESHRLHELEQVVDLVKDQDIREVMTKKLKDLQSKAQKYDKETEMKRSSVFIGSSAEGLNIAEAIQLNLDHSAEPTIWSQGVFGLGEGTLEALVRAVGSFDFAILVLTPDDLVEKRGQTGLQARDNVLFELGLFMGRLGRDRTFIVHERGSGLDLPSDLAGITPATFAARVDNNYQASLGPVCTQIKLAMQSALSS